jgi:isopropylmalate/homocitrate/citramalate synthase
VAAARPSVQPPVGEVMISDCTLREGEQQPGVILNTAQKLAIAELLGAVGMRRAEIGTPAVSEGEREAIAAVVAAGRIAETIGVCRARTDDVALAHECGLWGVVISSPVSPHQLVTKLGWSVSEMVRAAVKTHGAARDLGLRTFASAYDTLRSSREDIRALYGELKRQELIDGVRIVDTVGVGTPKDVRELVRWCDDEFGLPIEVHFHDDFGLATANALSAVESGAQCVSCSIAGVGERAGNVATEEIVAALELLLHISTGIQLDLLGPAFITAAEVIGVRLQDNRAIIGRNSFRHVSGVSIGGLIRSPLAAQPIEAEVVGRRSEIVFGKTSGRAAIEHVLRTAGIEPTALDVGGLVHQVKTASESTGRILSVSDLLRLVSAQHRSPARLDRAQPGRSKDDA